MGPPSEEMRIKLLQEELKLRSKQPEHWAKTKYRKFAERMKHGVKPGVKQSVKKGAAKPKREKGSVKKKKKR